MRLVKQCFMASSLILCLLGTAQIHAQDDGYDDEYGTNVEDAEVEEEIPTCAKDEVYNEAKKKCEKKKVKAKKHKRKEGPKKDVTKKKTAPKKEVKKTK